MKTDIDLSGRIRSSILDVAGFPAPGIVFRDITPLLADPKLFQKVVEAMYRPWESDPITHVAAIESRGFLFGVPVALAHRLPFIPIRKPGKLPRQVARESFALEYGQDTLEIHSDAIGRGSRVLLIDDVLATGGTAAAACRLIERQGATVAGVSVLMELDYLGGRQALEGRLLNSLCVISND